VRRKIRLGVGVSVAALLVVPGLVSAGDPPSARNLTVTVRDAALTPVGFEGMEPAAPGDMLVKDSPVYDAGDDRRIGHSPISCVFVDPESAPRCNAEVVLERGTIALQGVLDQPRFVFAIVGGTGMFANARGEARARLLGTTDRVRITIRLR
jgi:hypothetical protein